jgi:hypothetical protein
MQRGKGEFELFQNRVFQFFMMMMSIPPPLMGRPLRRVQGDVLFLCPELTESWQSRSAFPPMKTRYRDD